MTIVRTDTTHSHTNPQRERGVAVRLRFSLTLRHSSLTLRVGVTTDLIDNLNPRSTPLVETRMPR